MLASFFATTVLLSVGASLAFALRARAFAETSLLAGLVTLHLTVLAHDALGLPLLRGTVLVGLLAVALMAVGVGVVSGQPRPRLGDLPRPMWAAGAVLLLGALFASRVALQPLTGFDVCFRWGALAELMLEHQSLAFYPPTSGADYRRYFYSDGIAPFVSSAYWWTYAVAGQVAPRATAPLVVLQWVGCCALTWRIAARLGGPRAGAFAGVVLATCPLFARSIGIGQETGLTALGLLAALYALLADDDPPGRRALLVAGLGLGAAASAREYGWVFAAPVVLAAHVRGVPLRRLALVLAAAVVAAGPWHLRCYLRTGDPLHGDLALFGPDPTRLMVLVETRIVSGWGVQLSSKLIDVAVGLATLAIVPATVGVLGLALDRRARVLIPAVGVVVTLWVASVPYTGGGVNYSLRVLTPALGLLAVGAGLLVDRRLTPGSSWTRATFAGAAALVGLWAIITTLSFPVAPQTVPWRELPRYLVTSAPLLRPVEMVLRDIVPPLVPQGGTLVAANQYAWVALRGSSVSVIPIWSPEARCLFEPGLSDEATARRLEEAGIVGYIDEPPMIGNSCLLGSPYLQRTRGRSQALATINERWTVVLFDRRR